MQNIVQNYLRDTVIGRFTTNRNGCWIWGGSVNYDKYGQWFIRKDAPNEVKDYFADKGIKYQVAAHRISYLAFNGEIPKDKPLVIHSCNNPKCINPQHLRIGTQQDNVDDKVDSGNHKNKRVNLNTEQMKDRDYRIMQGQSCYSIAKIYKTTVWNVSQRAKRMKEMGYPVPPRRRANGDLMFKPDEG